jgi:hypothetical protein
MAFASKAGLVTCDLDGGCGAERMANHGELRSDGRGFSRRSSRYLRDLDNGNLWRF